MRRVSPAHARKREDDRGVEGEMRRSENVAEADHHLQVLLRRRRHPPHRRLQGPLLAVTQPAVGVAPVAMILAKRKERPQRNGKRRDLAKRNAKKRKHVSERRKRSTK